MTAKSPLSIVHVAAPARFGGLETVLASLLPAQLEIGDSVCLIAVLTHEDAADHPLVESLQESNVTVCPVVIDTRQYLRERAVVRDILLARAADICHTHGYRSDVIDASVARRAGVKTVSTVHGYTGGGWKNRAYEWIQTRTFRRFDAVAAVSTRLETDLLARGVSSSRLHVVRNSWTAPSDPLTRTEACRELGVPPEGERVGWVGRLNAEKGPDVFVRAAAQVQAPGATFSIIGAGALEPDCRSLAESLELGGVTWHGAIARASRFLRAFDCLVLSSWTEGTPMILLEAMAAEVPTLGDRQSAVERAAAARRRLDADFAVSPWAARYRDIYRSILG